MGILRQENSWDVLETRWILQLEENSTVSKEMGVDNKEGLGTSRMHRTLKTEGMSSASSL